MQKLHYQTGTRGKQSTATMERQLTMVNTQADFYVRYKQMKRVLQSFTFVDNGLVQSCSNITNHQSIVTTAMRSLPSVLVQIVDEARHAGFWG
jgi:hypothetical protein